MIIKNNYYKFMQEAIKEARKGLKCGGIQIINLNMQKCMATMRIFIKKKLLLWNKDIGE